MQGQHKLRQAVQQFRILLDIPPTVATGRPGYR
jgi:hypothetical protein